MRRPGWPTVFFNPGWIGLSHPYVPYKGDRQEQPSVGHQAVIIEGDLDAVRVVAW